MDVFEDSGICIKGLDLAIDPSKKSGHSNAFISHAHSDHVNLNSGTNFLMSEQTKHLVETIYGKKSKISPHSFGKKFSMNDFDLSLHNSGHILGSSQLLVEGEKTIVITSDFKLQKSSFLPSAEILPCDILVIESTFGLPNFVFPEREAVCSEISKWVNENVKKNNFVVLAGYSLGKAQELTSIVNEHCGIVPIVHETIFKNNSAYRELGINVGNFLELDHNLKESNVLIMPPSLINQDLLRVLEYSIGKNVVSGIATGWQYRSFYDKVFPLSDHCDFSQLMEYIKLSNPKMVLTMHGYAKEFAGFVNRRLKIPAKPLEEKGQKLLFEYS